MASNFEKTTFVNDVIPPGIDAEFLNKLQDEVIRLGNQEIPAGSVNISVGQVKINLGTTISNDYEITLPENYKVGNNSLLIFWDGVLLIKVVGTADGHYKEVGEVGSSSNLIKMNRTTSDGNYTLTEDVILTEVVIGTTETSVSNEGGAEDANTHTHE